MDALTIPAAGGVDTSAVIIGDYSNGNDGIVLKTGKTLADIKGQKVNLVELSVSHYLLARALATRQAQGERHQDRSTPPTPTSSRPSSRRTSTAVVTWNPQLMEVKAETGVTEVFDSSKIPGEILDLMVVNTETLKDNPEPRQGAGRHLVRDARAGAGHGAKGVAARTAMAKASGTDLAGFDAQLKTTKMFYTPKDAVAFANSADLPKISDLVRTFSFEHGLLGDDAKSKDAIGIAMPDGKIQGSATNVKLRFDTTYMKLAGGREALDATRPSEGVPMRRAMNIVPRRGGRLALALLPFLLIAIIYGLASTERHADNPDDKVLPVVGQMADTIAGAAFEPDRRTGELTLWTDTAASLEPARGRDRRRGADRAHRRHGDRAPAARRGDLRAARRGDLDDPADGGPADPVHRLRPRRPFQDRADRLRHRAVPGARPGAGAWRPCRASRW